VENARGDASWDFRLKLHAGKPARAVSRGGGAGNSPDLPGAGVEREKDRGIPAREASAGAGARGEAFYREGLGAGAKEEGRHFDWSLFFTIGGRC